MLNRVCFQYNMLPLYRGGWMTYGHGRRERIVISLEYPNRDGYGGDVERR